MKVRKTERADAPALLQLIRALAEYEKLPPPDESAQERLVRDLFAERPKVESMLVEIDGRAVGYTFFFETYSTFLASPTLFLEDLFVLQEFRGKGAGAALFRAVAAEAVRRECGRMEWSVLDWNQIAIDFYERFQAKRLTDWQSYRLTGPALAQAATARGRMNP